MSFPFFETFILSLFDVLQYYVITNKLNNGKIQLHWWHAIGIPLCTFFATVSSVSTEGIYAYFINTFIFMTLAWVIYRRKGLQLVYLHIIGISLVLTVQLVVIFLIYAFVGKIEYTSNVGMIAQATGLIIAYCVSRFVPIHLLFNYVEAKNDLFRVVTLNVFVLLTFCIVYWYLNFTSVVENLISISVIIVIVLFINLIFLREGLKNHVVEEQNRAYELYLPIVNELMDEIRVKQHDFDNHIAALKMVLEQRKGAESTVETVENYIYDAEASFQNVDLLKMKNQVVAGFLYSKKKKSIEEGIELDIRIDDYHLSTALKDYELLDVLSVLIDNAFETGVQSNNVRVHFYKEKDRSVIEVSNKHPYLSIARINEFFIKGFSSKSSNKRGIGLYKLKQIISNKHGEIEVQNADFGENFIVFKIVLP